MEYAAEKAPRRHTDAYYMVLQSVVEDLRPREKIVPISKKCVTQHQNFPGPKSAGLPYKQRGLVTKRQAIEEPGVMDEISELWRDIGQRKNIDLPDVAVYARAQICEREKNKGRATWGYPLAVYLLEGTYFYPIPYCIPGPIYPSHME